MPEPVISSVADTARWVAEYRAQESARPDALFDDPLAAGLAGERGRAIAEAARRTFGNGWFFIARTKLIDDLVARCLADGCDRVVNLAAGFDTRPYRLALPESLSWVEMDLPEIVAEKSSALAGESPRCAVTRLAVDLTDPAERRRCLAEATAGAARPLVVTEGLLLYLEEPTVQALAADLRAAGTRWWVTDIIGPGIMALTGRSAQRNSIPLRFGPPTGVAFFEQAGWTVGDCTSQLVAAARWRRLPRRLRPLTWLPQPDPRSPGRKPWSAVLRLQS